MSEVLEIVEQQQDVAQVAENAIPSVEAVATATTETSDNASSSVSTENETPITTSEQVIETPSPAKLSREEILAQLGMGSDDFEEFQRVVKEKKELAEQPIREQKSWAKKTEYGINEGLITKEDVLNFELISQKSNEDLVFEDFKKDFEFSDADLTAEEKEEEIQTAYDNTFHRNAKGKAKEIGDDMIAKRASEIRSSSASKITDVDNKYNQVQSVKNLQKSHEAIFNQLASSKITDSVEIDGVKIDYEIPFEVTQDEVKEILKSDGSILLETMYSLNNENKESANKMYSDFVTQLAKEKAGKTALTNAIWEKAKDHFRDLYSVGGKAPFKEGNMAIVEQSREGLAEKDYMNKRTSY